MPPAADTPAPSSDVARTRMRRTRQRDTGPELAVRAALWRHGVRGYRVGRRPLPGLRRNADIVFTRQRVAVFVDGCFWHGCPAHGTRVKANGEWWDKKLGDNRTRDDDTDERLADGGWTVVRAWEHESPERVATVIGDVLAGKAEPASEFGGVRVIIPGSRNDS